MVLKKEIFMLDEIEIESLKAQDRYERRYRSHLWAHPDCRDPDHPGCEMCWEDEEEDEDDADESN